MTAQSAGVCKTVELAREMWFAERIAIAARVPFCGIFAGTTDPPARAQRARELILKYKLASTRVVSNRLDNFADCYLRLYGVPLSNQTPALSSPTQHEIAL